MVVTNPAPCGCCGARESARVSTLWPTRGRRGERELKRGWRDGEVPRTLPGESDVRRPSAPTPPAPPSQAYWFTVFDDALAPVLGARPSGSGAPRLSARDSLDEAAQVVSGWGGGILECIAATAEADVVRNSLGDRWVWPGSSPGCGLATLVGDALHPSTPNLGAGGALALEGAVRLAGALGDARRAAPGRDWARVDDVELEAAFRSYERAQTKRAFPLQARSWAMGAVLHLRTDSFLPGAAARSLSAALGPALFGPAAASVPGGEPDLVALMRDWVISEEGAGVGSKLGRGSLGHASFIHRILGEQ